MKDERLNKISEQIVRLANADFSHHGELSENGDDLDAITIGLNLLGEELESYIGRLHQSEIKLKHTLHQLTEAQRLSHIGSWEWDVRFNKITWTDELFRIYGRNPATFESTIENFLLCVHPDEREYVNNIIQTAFAEKKSFSFSHRSLRPDGKLIFLDCKGNVYTDTENNVVRMTGTAQDVTELKNAEEKILSLAAIVESSSDAIISKTLDGIIVSWNKRAENIFGYTEQEVAGKHISIIFPTDDLQEEDAIIAQIRSGNPLIAYETVRKRKDGTLISVSATISPIKNSAGAIVGVSKIVRDITEKKLAEEQLVAYTKALEQKNKETEQFAYIASHDLQEPLRTITNYIGLFHDDYHGKLEGNGSKYLDFIRNASRRMQKLITDLLEYTRIDKGAEVVQVDLNRVMMDLVDDMQKTISDNDVLLEIGPLPTITGYPSRLKSLFQNLISNAIKFRKKDVRPVVSINCIDTGKEWQFSIEDNGIGIDEAYHEKIFMIFQRLHTRDQYEGTGIGLAHCKKIVELRGGKIWFRSALDQGTTFYFTLPKKMVI